MNPDQLSNLLNETYQPKHPFRARLGKKVAETVKGLVKVSNSEDLDVYQIAELFETLSSTENDEIVNLELLNQCILTAQQMIEKNCPALSQAERVVKEYRLMGGLFQLMAEQLED